MLHSSLAVISLLWAAAMGSVAMAAPDAGLGSNDIGGVVTSGQGAEPGVWVIAETNDLKTAFTRIVVSDDAGRYLLPELPPATYRVWVRGYGLTDSDPVDATPGHRLNLRASRAATPALAAQIYPPNYWYALLHPPAEGEFPGTGDSGNGINPGMTTQQEWMASLKEDCIVCHPLGDQWTRNLPSRGDPSVRWEHRLAVGRGTIDDPRLNSLAQVQRGRMVATTNRLGHQRSIGMLADWTSRIEAGEVPASPPPRPSGIERNVVLTLWGWALTDDGLGAAVHDEIATDKRHPSINANGPVYGTELRFGRLAVLDPRTNVSSVIDIPGYQSGERHRIQTMPHNPMIDQKGRVWTSLVSTEGVSPSFCSNPAESSFAAYFPHPLKAGRQVALYDPATGKVNLLPVCFNVHHLNFASDADNTLYFSGDTVVLGWLKTSVWDRTHDVQKAQGWCPMVLDTNGDGRIEPDRTQWNGAVGTALTSGEEENALGLVKTAIVATDPTRDTQITGYLYGLNVNPTDQSVWAAVWRPGMVPSAVVRIVPGSAPPQSCRTEYYEPPRRSDGNYAAYNARGVDLDSHGVAWVAFGSGQLGRFDRHRCKLLKGPAATGQHCPEGWSFYDMPGPKVSGVRIGTADWPYLVWVDLHNVLGLGKDVPILDGSNSDSLLAFLPDSRKWVTIRVPYPMGFFPRGMDARIDDAKAGWKGRGLWAAYGMSQNASVHIEGVTPGKLVKVQIRPDPLAH